MRKSKIELLRFNESFKCSSRKGRQGQFKKYLRPFAFYFAVFACIPFAAFAWIAFLCYSLRKQSVGFTLDALKAWNATVDHATINAINPAPIKYQG
jgi:hypothetical protein